MLTLAVARTAHSRRPPTGRDAAVAARVADIGGVRKIEAMANRWYADEPAVLIGHGNDWSQPEADSAYGASASLFGRKTCFERMSAFGIPAVDGFWNCFAFLPTIGKVVKVILDEAY